MVICQFFLNNNCRFGSKCMNDHVDIKGMIKSEIEAAVKGNQWPLSCFGPFKEKPSIPNLIEDQSFEEIRWMFNEAKMQNDLQRHEMDLGRLITESKSKLQSLVSMSQDAMNVIIGIYNMQEGGALELQNLSQQQQQQALNSTQVNNPFAANIATNTTPSTTSIFGSSSFGSSFSTVPTANSIFGGSQTAVLPNQNTSSIFGPPSNSNAFGNSGVNIFNKAAEPAAANQNIFGLSGLGQQQKSSSIFWAPPVFGAQHSIFGGTPAQSTQQQAPNNIFVGGFGQQVPPQQSMPVFAASPASQQQVPQQQVSQPNIFQSVPQQQQQPAFGMGTPQLPQQIFGNTGSPFAQISTQQPQQPQTNIFSTNFQTVPTTTSSIFAQPPQQASSLFTPAPQLSQQPQTFQQLAVPIIDDWIYSKLENLTPEQLQAFQSDHFEIGKLPIVPPPKELCH